MKIFYLKYYAFMLMFIFNFLLVCILIFYIRKTSRMKKEMHNTSNELTRLHEDLELHVTERTVELQNAIHELEAFNYTVAHDLKSPIRAVDGYSRIILEDYGEKLEGEASEMVVNIRNICKDTIEMINSLLQYSTTSRLNLSMEEIDIKDIFISVFREFTAIHPERILELIIETKLPKVFADRVLLKQVISNIFSNTVKFTKDNEKSFIIVGNTILDNEYVFYVKDNGVGFDMEYAGKLFGLFQRLHSDEEFEGSGIGLVTVKNIIQRHGGRVWIEGEVNLGATVYFTLPFSRREEWF